MKLLKNVNTIQDQIAKRKQDFLFGRKNCDIWNVLELGNDFKSTTTGDVYKIDSHFRCNVKCVVYLLICTICRKQYVGSFIKKFKLQFKQYKSNIKLHREGRRNSKQEKLIEHYYS